MEIWENKPFKCEKGDADFLQRCCKGLFKDHENGYVITRLVGHILLPSKTTLIIKSRKASNASILAWLAYADPKLSALKSLGKVNRISDKDGDLSSVVARLFLHEFVKAANQCGLIRNYRRRQVFSAAVRGRIDFQRLVYLGGNLSKLPCITWERVPNTPLNRFLSAALHKIESDRIMCSACGDDLPKARVFLDGVQPKIDSFIMDGKCPLARNEQPFELTLNLARLILRENWFSEGQKLPGESFLVNLETLFEKAVTRAFLDAGEVEARAQEPVNYTRIHNNTKKFTTKGGPMRIDLFLPNLLEGPVVIDSKYKTDVCSANLQQMVTYCVRTGAKRAVLVFPAGYPAGDKENQSYVFESPLFKASDNGSHIRIDTVQFDTAATDLQGWRSSANRLVQDVLKSGKKWDGEKRDVVV